MNKNLTDITVLLDRSQSMTKRKQEAEDGLNAFVKSQQEQEGRANFTFIKFDDHYEVALDAVDIQNVEKCALEPRGCTALLDALGKAIVNTGERLKNMHEKYRPGLVVICVITDGHENSSREFTKSRIKEMIEEQTEKYNWQFTFLGADQDAFTEGAAMGFQVDTILNYSNENTEQVFGSISRNVNTMRGQKAGGQMVSCSYTAEEREAAVE